MRTSVSSLAALVLLGSTVWLGACLELPSAPSAPADASPSHDSATNLALYVEVLDARGDKRPLDAIPRSPHILVHGAAALSADPEPLHLLAALDRADDEASLRDDLASAPLRSQTLARAIACTRARDGDAIELRPIEPLAPGARVHVAIGAWARDGSGARLAASHLTALRVDPGERGGARAIEIWPPEGSTAVPAALPLAAVRFDGVVIGVEDGLWLEDASGSRIESAVHLAPCDELGWPSGHCARIAPAHPLTPGAAHRIRSGPALIDATGASVPALDAGFATALEPDTEPPRLLALACALDERASEAGCVLADDARVALRVRASEPVRLRLESAQGAMVAIAPRGDAELALTGLAPSTALDAVLEAIDLGGHATRVSLELATTEPLAPLSITEVRADPHGTEPRQEFVEVANLGETTLDLAGFTLSDSAAEIGDAIAGPARLAPGARALIVAEGFDPDDRGEGERDVAIAPGIALFRVDRSLGAAGLSNTGEPLFLRDPEGRRVSAAPAEPAPRAGVCIARVSSDPRTGARGSFDYDAGGSCTPGR